MLFRSETFDFVRVSGCADIEILWLSAQKQIADTPSDEIRPVVMLLEPVENLQRIGIDLFAGDRVFGARHDHRSRHRSAL